MKKYGLLLLGLLFLFASCSGEDQKSQMVVEGRVKGLKKGTLYLQYIPDSVLVTLDSLEIRGDGAFRLQARVGEPDLYYLYLSKADNNILDDRISFFGEPGQYRIESSWNAFEADAVIRGTESQEKYAVYKENMSRFNLERLELARALNAVEETVDSARIDSLQSLLDQNLRRSYLYTLNFALNNKDSYLAPFITFTEVPDANPKYLDSVYQALPPDIAGSKYGKKLKELLGTVR
ncbi:MAG: DUF4369 domain-containing protein [Robiginitalea sp.]